MTILSILAETPRHQDLAALTSIAGAPLIGVPVGTLGRADLVVTCADGTSLGVAYLDLLGLFHALRTQDLMARLITVKQRWPWAYLILGAVPSPTHDGRNCRNAKGDSSGWDWNAVQGALLSVQEMGVGVIQLPHADMLGAALERLAKRDRGPVRAKPVRDALFYTPALELLMALPGIGEGKAEALLAYCGGRADLALLCLTDPDVAAPGIGPKTKAACREALGMPDGEKLILLDGPVQPSDIQAAQAARLAA